MKKQTLIVTSLCFAVAFTAVSAKAQNFDAKVPFSFIVSGKTLPAGDYTMTINGSLLKIAGGDGRIVALASVYDASDRPNGEQSQIVFHCYGDRCFLAEFWSAQQSGRGLPTSRAEAKLAKEESGKYFAVLGEEPLKRK